MGPGLDLVGCGNKVLGVWAHTKLDSGGGRKASEWSGSTVGFLAFYFNVHVLGLHVSVYLLSCIFNPYFYSSFIII